MEKLQIVSLKPKKKAPNTFVLEFEEAPPLPLHLEVVARFSLYQGAFVDSRVLEEAIALDEEVRCREAAWRLLSLRPRTCQELIRALRQRRFLRPTVEALVAELAGKGFLNDEQYARQFVEERTRKRHGPRLIEQELRQRGLPPQAAQEAVAEARDPERERGDARALLEKWNRRSKPEEPRKRAQAAAQFLARKGYESDLIWEVVRQVIRGTEEE